MSTSTVQNRSIISGLGNHLTQSASSPVRPFTHLRLATVLMAIVWTLFLPQGRSMASANDETMGGVLYAPSDPSQFAGYPRVIRLAHSETSNGTLIALFDTFREETDRLLTYQSTDDGRTWTQISTLTDSSYSGRMCCATLFELPKAMGKQASGTLLLGESAGAAGTTEHEIRVFRSTDHGHSWSYFSSCAKGSGGLWEPDFSVNSSGNLVCYFSDERRLSYSQFLGHVTSTDGGRTWGEEQLDIGVPDGMTRPGMATVVQVSADQYVMSFEVCGLPNCPVHIKMSVDGDHWGDPTSLGEPVQTTNGDYAGRTPYVALLQGTGNTATLVLTSKDMFAPDGLPASQTRRTLLINHQGGTGKWTLIDSPLTIPEDGPDCASYSSALLPEKDGRSVFLVAAIGLDAGGCEIRYGRAPIAETRSSPATPAQKTSGSATPQTGMIGK